MDFLHSEFTGGPGDVALVTLDGQANVMLLDDLAFAAYRSGGGSFSYLGGWATRSPVRLAPPRQGHWHVVVDLGGYAGSIRAGIRVVCSTAAAADPCY
jgi:hypothetical protein